VDEPTPARPDEHPFAHLPEPIRLEDMLESVAVTPAPDPEMGRDTQTDFLLRNSG